MRNVLVFAALLGIIAQPADAGWRCHRGCHHRNHCGYTSCGPTCPPAGCNMHDPPPMPAPTHTVTVYHAEDIAPGTVAQAPAQRPSVPATPQHPVAGIPPSAQQPSVPAATPMRVHKGQRIIKPGPGHPLPIVIPADCPPDPGSPPDVGNPPDWGIEVPLPPQPEHPIVLPPDGSTPPVDPGWGIPELNPPVIIFSSTATQNERYIIKIPGHDVVTVIIVPIGNPNPSPDKR